VADQLITVAPADRTVNAVRFHFVFEAADYDAAIRFYGEGLRLPVAYSWDRGCDRGTMFEAGNGIIEIVSDALDLRGPAKLGVVIETDNLDEVYRQASAAGLPVHLPPGPRSWGTREFVLLDPDGHAVTFFQEPLPEARGEP
jgi:catechol 2,3-dioxygenase-like lactoylglutathione lyase family enzyme